MIAMPIGQKSYGETALRVPQPWILKGLQNRIRLRRPGTHKDVNMGEIFFPGDSYHTPEGRKKFWRSLFSFSWLMIMSRRVVKASGQRAKEGNYTGDDWSRASFESLQYLESLGVRLHVEGMDNLDKVDGPCVFVSNHMSTMETVLLPVFIQPRKDVTFVVKESLMGYKWFKWVLMARQAIVIKRTNPREDFNIMMNEGMTRIEKGMSVVIFPQGTRHTYFNTADFNSIGVKLAKKAGVPVIPIALRTDALGMGKIIKDFGSVRPELPTHFLFGDPVYIEGNEKAEHARINDFIARHHIAWGVPFI